MLIFLKTLIKNNFNKCYNESKEEKKIEENQEKDQEKKISIMHFSNINQEEENIKKIKFFYIFLLFVIIFPIKKEKKLIKVGLYK